MAYRPPVAVYDACVLYPFHLRNLLVQLGVERLAEPRWTDEIHDEWIRNLVRNVPAQSAELLTLTRDLMNRVVPTANVTGYAHLIPAIELPDRDDRHVVAAGIAAGASILVTWNLRDFPAAELRKHGLRKLSPDAFLMEIYDATPKMMAAAVANARSNLRKSAISAADFVEALRRQKLKRFSDVLMNHIADL
jgi:hypothetical protein